jgi:hypothetical protein
MNKKAEIDESWDSEIITTIMIILLVLAAIVIVWQVVDNSGIFGVENNYKITINICENKTALAQAQCFYDENTTYLQVKKCLDNGPYYREIQKEVCEDKEVNEIYYLDQESNYCMSHQANLDTALLYCLQIKEKKDINKEWLSLNCKCQDKTGHNFEYADCMAHSRKDCTYACLVYNCFNFTVEKIQ